MAALMIFIPRACQNFSHEQIDLFRLDHVLSINLGGFKEDWKLAASSQAYSRRVFLDGLPMWALSWHETCDPNSHWTYDDVHCRLTVKNHFLVLFVL